MNYELVGWKVPEKTRNDQSENMKTNVLRAVDNEVGVIVKFANLIILLYSSSSGYN